MKVNIEESVDLIVNQFSKFMGTHPAIIGISGGIDSAVVASLCVRALGKKNVIGVMMPYGTQSIADSELVAKSLGINYIIQPIERVTDAVLATQNMVPNSDLTENQFNTLTCGNARARTRMIILYTLANHFNGMVIGTTNKTEMMIGYFTKFGDGACDVEPIASLYKTDVWKMAEFLGLPKSIIEKKPSAELWAGQTDESDIGLTYKEMDEMLPVIEEIQIKRARFGVSETVKEREKEARSRFGKDKFCKLMERVRGSEHKRNMPPSFRAIVDFDK